MYKLIIKSATIPTGLKKLPEGIVSFEKGDHEIPYSCITIGLKTTLERKDWDGKPARRKYTATSGDTINVTVENPKDETYGMYVPIPVHLIPELIEQLKKYI